MPIRLNLLAEAQAQEEMRRRDPVKRAVAIGVILIAIMAVWSLYLGFKGVMLKKDIATLETLVSNHENEHKEVMNDQKRLAEVTTRLAALEKLSTNRFLVGSVMNALQKATLDDVQLARLRLDQSLTFLEEVKASANSKRQPHPANVTQKVILTLDARDSSATPGDLVPKFQQVLADAPYFATMLDKSDPQRVRLKEGSYGSIQPGGPGGRPYRPFTLECHFPEKTR
jgi:hypothetical protein